MPRSAEHLIQHQFKRKEVAPESLPPHTPADKVHKEVMTPKAPSFAQQKYALTNPDVSCASEVGAPPKKAKKGLMPSRFR